MLPPPEVTSSYHRVEKSVLQNTFVRKAIDADFFPSLALTRKLYRTNFWVYWIYCTALLNPVASSGLNPVFARAENCLNNFPQTMEKT